LKGFFIFLAEGRVSGIIKPNYSAMNPEKTKVSVVAGNTITKINLLQITVQITRNAHSIIYNADFPFNKI